VPILALVISLSTMGLVNAESNDTSTGTTTGTTTTGSTTTGTTTTGSTTTSTTTTGQTNVSCTQDEITAAKQGLADTQKKMTDIRTQYYNDWQTAHNAGQYSGTFEQYSREKISNSADVSQIKSDYQKYISILRSCGVGPMHQPNYSSSTTCSQSDITNARQELATTQKQAYDLRNKAYQQFQQDQASGQYNGTWGQYAKDNLYNLPEITQLKSTHDKYSSFLKSCFGTQYRSQGAMQQNPDNNGMPPLPPTNTNNPDSSSSPPDNLNTFGGDLGSIGNSTGLPPIDQSQNPTPVISSPTDALGTLSSHSIPGWVKGVAAWWAQGKISDDEFVSAIKFLVKSGIIKI
jgi:hypothetical protein